jgi:hypothetical protein
MAEAGSGATHVEEGTVESGTFRCIALSLAARSFVAPLGRLERRSRRGVVYDPLALWPGSGVTWRHSMRARLAVVLSALVFAACAEPPSTPLPPVSRLQDAPLVMARGPDGVPGQYIVVFNDDVADPHGRPRKKRGS